MPVNLPSRLGITLVTALAAPVADGMMFIAAVRPPRQSLWLGPSTVFWVAVYEWTVVIRPSIMLYFSWITLASGERQFVVHEALLQHIIDENKKLNCHLAENERAEKAHNYHVQSTTGEKIIINYLLLNAK
jgi:hypothetical protein